MPEDRMLRYICIRKKNVYKQNETKHYLGGKGNERVALIKSLICAIKERHTIKDEKKVDQNLSKSIKGDQS